jgi:molybdate transport system regulatory protein
LLELIGQTGSLRAAAARMGMSYMRAWTLVKSTNHCFSRPLVVATRGGRTGGGATLTQAGKDLVSTYRAMERESQAAIGKKWARLRKFLHP